jgi:hypothetical protein
MNSHMKWLVLSLLLLTGCASKHAYHSNVPVANQCRSDGRVCDVLGPYNPNQLTPAGCFAHTIVTGGHIAWECRKPKHGQVPTGGRWIW